MRTLILTVAECGDGPRPETRTPDVVSGDFGAVEREPQVSGPVDLGSGAPAAPSLLPTDTHFTPHSHRGYGPSDE
jgi:hypothetical protein